VTTAMTKTEMAEAVATLWDLLLDGNSEKDSMELMGLDAPTFQVLKQKLLDEKAAELKNKPAEHVYVEYIIWQTQGILDLTKMMDQFRKTKQYNAMIGAVRVRAELYDKLIAKGQEFGVFKKTPERKEIVAGMVLSDMTSKDLQGAVLGAIGELQKMMKRYGDKDIIDLDPGPTHRGPALLTTGEGTEVAPVAPRGKDDAPAAEPKPSEIIPKKSMLAAPSRAKAKMPPFKNAKAKTSRQSSAARGARPRDAVKKVRLTPASWGD
jgi:hypothetical protein